MAPSHGTSNHLSLSIYRGPENPSPAARRISGPVSGVIFDACGVFYDDSAWRRWLLRVLRQLNVATNYRSFFRLWDRDFLVHVHRGTHNFAEAFRAFMLAIGLSQAQIDEVEAACQARRRVLESNIRPLPGVKSTLARLQQSGLRLGVLADCELHSEALAERLDRLGLDGLFTAVMTSIDLRQTKPHPSTYQAAAQALGLRIGEVAFVGHETEELAGAMAVGMPTIAVNFDADAQAHVCLARFEELLDVLDVRRTYAKAG